MCCNHCMPTKFEEGVVHGREYTQGELLMAVAYCDCDEGEDEPVFALVVMDKYTDIQFDIFPKSEIKYCPFCGGEYDVKKFEEAFKAMKNEGGEE